MIFLDVFWFHWFCWFRWYMLRKYHSMKIMFTMLWNEHSILLTSKYYTEYFSIVPTQHCWPWTAGQNLSTFRNIGLRFYLVRYVVRNYHSIFLLRTPKFGQKIILKIRTVAKIVWIWSGISSRLKNFKQTRTDPKPGYFFEIWGPVYDYYTVYRCVVLW